MADGMQEKTVIRGTVEDVIFRSPDSDYAVIEVDCEGELITAVGELASVSEGEEITAFGQFVSHPTYGSQFRCEGVRSPCLPLPPPFSSSCPAEQYRASDR